MGFFARFLGTARDRSAGPQRGTGSYAWLVDQLRTGKSRTHVPDHQFDPGLQLYYFTFQSTGLVILTLTADAQGNVSAGSITGEALSDPNFFPFTFRISYNITAGPESGTGSFTYTINGDGSGSMSGGRIDGTTGEILAADLQVHTTEPVMTGDVIISGGTGAACLFSDMELYSDGTMISGITTNTGIQGAIQINVFGDADGTLLLDVPGEGRYIVTVHPDGSGTIRYPDGFVESFTGG